MLCVHIYQVYNHFLHSVSFDIFGNWIVGNVVWFYDNQDNGNIYIGTSLMVFIRKQKIKAKVKLNQYLETHTENNFGA